MPSIFISYRREDTSGEAGRLAEDLAEQFGRSSVFIDIDAIGPGADFEQRIRDALDACQMALVLIGDRWLDALPEERRRIDEEGDYVRQEIATALERSDVTVVPVLVEGAKMPVPGELPPEISALAKRNAFELSNKRWRYDVGQICELAQRHDRGWKRFLRRLPRWVKRGSPILALAVAGAVAIVLATGGGPDKATRVAACKRAHGLSASEEKRAPRPGESQIDKSEIRASLPLVFKQQTFASCTWPPAIAAEPDGYRALTVTMTNGPGENDASGRDYADRFESRCKALELQYTYAFMGHEQRLAPFRATTGDIWAPGGNTVELSRIGKIGTPTGDQAMLPFYPALGEIVVLYGGHYKGLERVQCVG